MVRAIQDWSYMIYRSIIYIINHHKHIPRLWLYIYYIYHKSVYNDPFIYDYDDLWYPIYDPWYHYTSIIIHEDHFGYLAAVFGTWGLCSHLSRTCCVGLRDHGDHDGWLGTHAFFGNYYIRMGSVRLKWVCPSFKAFSKGNDMIVLGLLWANDCQTNWMMIPDYRTVQFATINQWFLY